MVLRCVMSFPLLACSIVHAQQFPGEDNWKPLLEYEGVTFRYLYYRLADGKNAGVVMMLENTNAYAVVYSFKVVFRSEDDEVVREAGGVLEAGQRKAGSTDGLFWIPWDDHRAIGAIGLRGYRVICKDDPPGCGRPKHRLYDRCEWKGHPRLRFGPAVPGRF